MAYCTSSDIQDLIGEDNLAAWSQLDPDVATADDTRITRAITWADAFIDARLRGGRYALPITSNAGGVETLVMDCSRRLAAHWLYSSRGTVDNDDQGDRMTEHKDEADDLLDRIVSGQVILDAPFAANSSSPRAPEVVL